MGRGQELLNLVKSAKLNAITEEIQENVKPENIKKGVTLFGIEGQSADTSDATAIASDLDSGVIAYTANNKRISGAYPVLNTNTKPRMLKFEKRSNYNDSYGEIISTKNKIFMVNGESVYGEFGDIIEIPTSSLPIDITDKSVVCRFVYDNWPYGKESMRCSILELHVAPKGSRFQTRRDSGEDIMWCHNADLSRRTFDVYRIYRSGAIPFEQFDLAKWEHKGVGVSYYTSGKCNKDWWVFATEDTYSGGGSGLTYGTKITGFGDSCILKLTGGKETSTRFPKLKEGGVCYMKLDNEKIVKAVGIKAENIKKGETYLGVEGTMPDNNAMIKTSVAQQGSSSQILHCIEYLPDDLYVDSSTAQYLFAYMSSLKALPKNLNLSKVTQANYMCFRCYALEGNIKINVNNLTSVMDMFADCKLITSVEYFPTTANMFTELFDGCINLVEIPELNTANAAWSGMINPFRNCPKLSDNSLNNILAMCTKATAIAEAKTYANLKSTGLSQEQAAKCQTLSNWDAFVAAGWTTGYTELDTVSEE